MGVIPWSPLAGGWLSGRYRKGQELPTSSRAERLPQRFDLSIPGNQRKLEAADALGQLADDHDIPLVEIALAFVINHPAVTSAIIGPRTMGHLESQLPGGDRVLSRRAARPHRRDRPAGHELQPRRQRLRQPGVGNRPPPPLNTKRRAVIQTARRCFLTQLGV